MTITEDMHEAILKVPSAARTPAHDGEGRVRDGAWVADITGLLDLSSWPAGMRVIARKEGPHPGAQPRFATDAASVAGGLVGKLCEQRGQFVHLAGGAGA